MRSVLKYLGAGVVVAFAMYGAYALLAAHLTASQGKDAVEAASPFVQGAASAAGDKLKETLRNTPDENLEKNSEELSRKFYPIAKGAIKGQLEAILKDANRSEVPEKMYETGKDVSKNVVAPLSKGLAEGSREVLKDLDKSFQEVRDFREKNKDLIDAIASGFVTLKKTVPDLPPLPAPPGFGRPMPPPGPHSSQPIPSSETP
ncbi:MAG: hypothetical protein HY914_17420 [Desulfomonile tiedjei]|nr:hypothetical protein [Desulfomonile tiedjei]